MLIVQTQITPAVPYKIFFNKKDNIFNFSFNKPISTEGLSLKLFRYNRTQKRITIVNYKVFDVEYNGKPNLFITPELVSTATFSLPLVVGTKSIEYGFFDDELVKVRKTWKQYIGYHYISYKSNTQITKYQPIKFYIGIVDQKGRLVSNLAKYKVYLKDAPDDLGE